MEKEDKTISLTSLEPRFKFDLAGRAGAEGLMHCFSCGTCTASCPVSEIDPEYAPSKLIRMILWGMKDAVLSSNLIWMCAMCYNCSFNCPQDVRFADAMRVVREVAVEESFAPPERLAMMTEIDRFSQMLRHLILDRLLKNPPEGPVDETLLVQTAKDILSEMNPGGGE
ncbi:MAG: 4Fe-4S dicluster domain-containing protein [Deltaproteobacteria bacterium]|nr:4Fe-4S dicluster domain-containing protein [Deltaproteobacteria bacterium]